MRNYMYQRVGVHENALLVLREAPALQLRKGQSKVRTTEKFKVSRVVAVEHIHVDDGVESVQQLVSAHAHKHHAHASARNYSYKENDN